MYFVIFNGNTYRFDSDVEEAISKIKDVFHSYNDAATILAREFGIMTDDNEKYFDLDSYAEDMLRGKEYIGLYSGVVLFIGFIG